MTQRIGPAGGAAADDGSALGDPDAGDWLKGFTPEASEAFAALVDGYVRSHWVSMTASSTYTDIGVSLTFGLAVAGTVCVWHHVMRG